MAEWSHIPVLLDEVVRNLVPEPWDTDRESLWLDGTLGLGGHATAVLMQAGEKSRLLGLDKDQDARAIAHKVLDRFGSRVSIVASGFENMTAPAKAFLGSAEGFDGILLDLGISSMQVDNAERGFSFMKDAPLDMRLDASRGQTAAEWIAEQDEESLKKILREYGEEPRAGILARSILERRPASTKALADAVTHVTGKGKPGESHPATRVFQAIRIAVNDELSVIRKALPQAVALLKPGGRLGVISFHSLEDRIVKDFMADESIDCHCPKDLPVCRCGHKASLRKILRKVAVAGEDELKQNPRSRSAKLRVAQKL